MSPLYEIQVQTIEGQTQSLSAYQGKVLLIVNVASECGFTSQYQGLEALYQKYQSKGLVILGFPCNQFGGQEPGSDSEIQTFCTRRFGVTFPLFSKIEVNGPQTHPLYQYLKTEGKGIFGTEAIKWNFTKFLVSAEGKVIERFAPQTQPQDLEREIEKLLPAQA
jgi:glutathione peroxidase